MKPIVNAYKSIPPKKPPSFTKGSDCTKCKKLVADYDAKKAKYDATMAEIAAEKAAKKASKEAKKK